MSYKFDSIEVRDDQTFVVFKVTGTILSAGEAFNASARPDLYQEYTAGDFVSRKTMDHVDDIEWGVAANALIRHRMEVDEQYDSEKYERDLLPEQIVLLKMGRVVEALNLDRS